MSPKQREPIDIRVNIEERDGSELVGIQFNRKISWFGLTDVEADQFADFIKAKVDEIRSHRATP